MAVKLIIVKKSLITSNVFKLNVLFKNHSTINISFASPRFSIETYVSTFLML